MTWCKLTTTTPFLRALRSYSTWLRTSKETTASGSAQEWSGQMSMRQPSIARTLPAANSRALILEKLLAAFTIRKNTLLSATWLGVNSKKLLSKGRRCSQRFLVLLRRSRYMPTQQRTTLRSYTTWPSLLRIPESMLPIAASTSVFKAISLHLWALKMLGTQQCWAWLGLDYQWWCSWMITCTKMIWMLIVGAPL